MADIGRQEIINIFTVIILATLIYYLISTMNCSNNIGKNNNNNNNSLEKFGYPDGDTNDPLFDEGHRTFDICYKTDGLENAENDYTYYNMFKSQMAVPKKCDCSFLNNECNCIESTETINGRMQDYDSFTTKNSTAKRCQYINQNNQLASQELYDEMVNKEKMLKDNEKVLNNDIAFNNMNNFTTFNNMIIQNSNAIESADDKIAEIRTSGNEAEGFKKYGTKISDIFDNLVKTDADRYKVAKQPISGNSDFKDDFSWTQQLYSNKQNHTF